MTAKIFTALALTAFFPGALFAEELERVGMPTALAKVLDSARRDCASFDGGELKMEWGAVARPDLDGDSHPDWALDGRFLSCPTARTLFCGTGGCAVHFLVDDTASEFLAKEWRTTDMGDIRVLLLRVHGSECGGTNLTPCVRALTWDAQARKWRGTGGSGGRGK